MDNNLETSYIPDFQFGFKKFHSTNHALLKFQNDVVNNLREKRCSIAVSLDIEKAFDSIYHDGLIFKMINIGFSPPLIKLIHSFLTCRKFCVQVQNEFSAFGDIVCGVPQGSILAPHLYNIFTYDFPHVFNFATGILYADDSLLYAHGISPKNTLLSISSYLNEVSNYYKHWGIKINPCKSKAICLRNASGKCKYFVVPESKRLSLNIDGENIPFVDNIKYLGVNFNKLFKFNKHARTVLNKARGVKILFGRLFKSSYLPEKTKLLIYKLSIRPLLLYAFSTWFTISPTIMKDFEIFERKILRLCINKHFERINRKFSNEYIYDVAGVKPLASYAFDLMKRFINSLHSLDNVLIRNILNDQAGLSWLNTSYYSPLGYVEQEISCVNNLLPKFYVSKIQGAHRG